MKDNAEKIIENARKFSLTSEEKFAIKKQIISHIDKNKIQNNLLSFESVLGFLILRASYIVPVVLVVIVSGGLGVLAGKALPGNLLYPVKININENIESLTAISPESKAEVSLKQLNERLVEADTLKLNNDLTVLN